MKMLLPLAGSLALAALLHTAQAQVPATSTAKKASAQGKTTDQRAAAYKGPKVVEDSKALGHKMVQKSKPTDGLNGLMRVTPRKVE
jgi:hypothetical protein